MQLKRKLQKTLKILTVILLLWSINLDNPAIAQNLSALETFKAAYQNRYVWDRDFPGITADVVFDNGLNNYAGKIAISQDLEATVLGVSDQEVADWIKSQLQMEIIHRRPVPFDIIHGEDRFEFEGEDDSGKMLILEIDPVSDSFYQIQDQIFYQVNRVIGNIAVKVDTLETRQTTQGYLVSQFTVIFRDSQTEEFLEEDLVTDRHTQVGNYYLLCDRVFENDGEQTLRLQLDNIKLINSI